VILKKIFIDANVASHPETAADPPSALICLQNCVDDPVSIYRWLNSAARIRSDAAKQVLYLTRNKGGFLKPCPGTREYTCCDYQILHVASYCTMDCAYCILQRYFHPPLLQFFVNREDLDAELTGLFKQEGPSAEWAPGSITDSLIWERWTDLTGSPGHAFCQGKTRAVLELKDQDSQY
jgi:spore photoproduct lyase